jgi:hypothetical protein
MLAVCIGTISVMTLADQESRTELDCHAEQCVVGRHAIVNQDFERPTDVSSYDPTAPARHRVRTVSVAVAYTNPKDGSTIVLIIHQALRIPDLAHNLLCPNQMHLNNIHVNDEPKCLVEHPTPNTHAITIPSQHEGHTPLLIPLGIDGVVSYFPSCKPMMQEYQECPHYNLTAEEPPFEPHSVLLAEQETAPKKGMITCCQWGMKQ